MSVEDDVARVQAVTEKMAGPQKVWVLMSARIEREGAVSSASVYSSKNAALKALADDFDRDFYTEESVAAFVAALDTKGFAADGETNYILDELRVWHE